MLIRHNDGQPVIRGGVVIWTGAQIGIDPSFSRETNTKVSSLTGEYPPGAQIGKGTIVRPNALIYRGVQIGDHCFIGDGAVVRESVEIGEGSVVGANVVVENNCEIGNCVKIMTGAYVCAYTKIGDDCFVGPRACFLNDKFVGHPSVPRDVRQARREGPTLARGVHIGGNVTVLPGVKIASGVVVGAGCTVARSLRHSGIYFSKNVDARYEASVFSPYKKDEDSQEAGNVGGETG